MKKILPLILAALLLVSVVLVFSAPRAVASSGQQATDAPTPAINEVVVNSTIIPKYTILDFNGFVSISALVSLGQLPISSSSTTITVTTTFAPDSIVAQAIFANSTSPISLQPSSISTVSVVARSFTVSIPGNTTSATIAIQGSSSAESILGKYAMTLPFVTAQGPVYFAYSYNVLAPKGTVLSQTYGGLLNAEIEGSVLEPNPSPTTIGAPQGEQLYVIPTYVITLVFQPSWFEALSIALTFLGVLGAALICLGLFAKGRAILSNLSLKITSPIRRVWLSLSELIRRPSRNLGRPNTSSIFDSKRLLVLFLACSMLMVTMAAVSGPDPTFKAYVMAAPTEQPQIQSVLQSIVGAPVQIITPSQDYDDFQVMSNVGTFNMVIVSQYSSLQLQDVGGSVLPYFGNVPVIVVDNSSDPTFAAQINALYPETINVGSITNLNSTELSTITSAIAANQRHNILGLVVSNEGFNDILVIEGGLSFLLFFLGALFLGAKIAEPNDDKTLYRIAMIAMYGIFVFYFTEVVYVVTSATLAFPLSLHAVISGATSLTAVGLFGQVVHLPLGGGTTPRLVSGALGFFIGAYAMGSNRLFNKYSLALIVSILLILLLNPLYLGIIFYQVILLFIGSISSGLVASSALTFKGFLYGFGFGLGGDVSSTLLLSAGKILYFSALVPLAFIKKMGRTTATITLLLASVLIGDGGVRTGEMTPDKTVVAVFPGIISGVALAAILLLISAFEKYITSNRTRAIS